ncbi:hypothetical protein C1H46_017032 [Malus baccata]|uniref:Uncharacterized protein n=1 Tax=Malus baccata TaxID=106549 RepID=A0A540MF12_MALBA|nr:hypothetical protein C1H46_017032 [Malus baccata]
MDDTKNTAVPQDQSDADDTLSFCDFSLYNDDYDSYSPSPRKYPDTPDSLFEFFIDHPDFELDSSAVVFCGKTIGDVDFPQNTKLVQRDPRNGLFLFKTNSFKRSQSVRSPVDLEKSSVFRPNSPAAGSCRYQSSKSKKHRTALIGSLVKPQPKMELSDIKRRQSRLAPGPMFPIAEGDHSGELVAAFAADGGKAHKSPLRPLRCRSHLVSALVKASFGCIPSPKTRVELSDFPRVD